MILVIGYGNTLRGDDGIGPAVAAKITGPRVLSLAVLQLTPELAESLASAEAAVFIDARLGPVSPAVAVESLSAAHTAPEAHTSDPRGLLALAHALYGRAPSAWLVSVAGVDFGLKETLSPTGQHHARLAQEQVENLIRSCKSDVYSERPSGGREPEGHFAHGDATSSGGSRPPLAFFARF
jgi:hydrogenase maturation protease